ncbi:polar amino acid transport system ATP-binding protein [Spinactinospora alkalitolerans]|uniref:Polar amino acid transport system ATP-binding protein n=1 Tax=Spinactinospora alkalitolerans TaxID=687207 RepID=A0A852TTK4_9ACTN|nr:ectoine/hydroxyectoine ABC transporter ATP-binding protein EhuA [Spinactinospora alkalitolerans]NYE45270.1 polar amino acid transport system ATP-binding protein [Spinactinospora alkalitolerans]
MPQYDNTGAPQPRDEGPQAPGGPLIHFDKVVKRFGDNVVLRELDFDVAAGERVTLIGPSGSGKTTILRLLMTLEDVNGGVIWVNGQPLNLMYRNGRLVPANEAHLRQVRKKIGMVFQQFNLFPNMSVRKNLTEAPVHSLGVSKDEADQRAEELLEMVDLRDKIDAHPTQLSGGQQQRVAIARALAMQPEILLLDEVTSALDPELVAGVLDVLREIARTTDITMLAVTHEMGFAKDVSHRVLMFDGGQIVEEGPPERIFGDPHEERTKSFLHAVLESG